MNILKDKLADIVREQKVIFREEYLLDFIRANIGSGEKPMFIVKPQNTKHVEDLIALAKELKLNLVPASSKAPHMKGGTLLSNEGVVVDLSEMRSIMLIDRRNKVALIEPDGFC